MFQNVKTTSQYVITVTAHALRLLRALGPSRQEGTEETEADCAKAAMNTYVVCCAALLSLDNKACVHYHIYRLVLKRLLPCQT